MVRIYRCFLVGVLILLVTWGVWYVVSNYSKESTYEDGVLVWEEIKIEPSEKMKIAVERVEIISATIERK